MENVLTVSNRAEFRAWLEEHGDAKECWVALKRGRPVSEDIFYYIDAVEEALCFGWIDSTVKEIDGVRIQRFSPRQKSSPWTELNKERVRRLERLGQMTDHGRAVLPPMGPRSFTMDPDIIASLKANRVWSRFRAFPSLYQRVRAYNVAFYKTRDPATYEKALKHLIEATKAGQRFGEWNDYGRLLTNLIPRDKHDVSGVSDLLTLTDEEIRALLPELLTWLQDMNWPVSGSMIRVLGERQSVAESHVLTVLRGTDEMWKYNILSNLIPVWSSCPGNELMREITRIALNPTQKELQEEVALAARECMETWEQ